MKIIEKIRQAMMQDGRSNLKRGAFDRVLFRRWERCIKGICPWSVARDGKMISSSCLFSSIRCSSVRRKISKSIRGRWPRIWRCSSRKKWMSFSCRRPSDVSRRIFDAQIRVPSLDGVLEGAVRPGHFQGVATVVAKLFNIVQPSRAYFGQKDYQQIRVISRMVSDLNMPVRLVACPTVREKDGLACSSRNRYLSKSEREEAVKIYQALLFRARADFGKDHDGLRAAGKRSSQIFAKIPHSQGRLCRRRGSGDAGADEKIQRPALLAAAVRIGKTRLIDNLIVS